MSLDWRHLKAVVLESDDWGLCAWVPDEQAFRVLADTPAFRSAAGRAYGRSTLERAEDVARLVEILLSFRGGDGLPPVWQANTVMASPDYDRLEPPLFECETLPLLRYPEFPSRWRRPGLAQEVRRGVEAGVWWPELHGLVHLPQAAWLTALRRGTADARSAHAQQSFVCQAVEASAEFDPREPAEARTRGLALAVEWFRDCFGRGPLSLCAPDYRWDERMECDAESLGIRIIQGEAEQMGHPFPRLRHALHQHRWPHARGRRFYPPPRTAFEPRGAGDPRARLLAARAHRAARRAWDRAAPAVVSSHRLNYAHLDPGWAEAGRRALRDLLALLCGEGAIFLTDAEVHALQERGWSLRPLGDRAALLRYHGPARRRVRFPVPADVAAVTLCPAHGSEALRLPLESGQAAAELEPGAYRVEWSGA